LKGVVKEDKPLTTMISKLASKLVPLQQLEIARPDPHNPFQSAVKLWGWKLNVEISVISDDGGLEAAACLSLQEALKSLVLPKFDLDEEAKLIPNGETSGIDVTKVNGMRFGLFEGHLVYDPTRDEEKVSDGCCTVIMTRSEEPVLLKMATVGRFELSEETIGMMVGACLR
jgi:exosome complex RNA-binding protein Rrp42 (RNase PH superfamily)